jgi:hypothetical protein
MEGCVDLCGASGTVTDTSVQAVCVAVGFLVGASAWMVLLFFVWVDCGVLHVNLMLGWHWYLFVWGEDAVC